MATNTETLKRSEAELGTPHMRLVVLVGDQVATHWLPESGDVTLGRGGDCAIVIDEPSVSRLHARLHLGDQLSIEDLGSANGSYVDDRRLARGERGRIPMGGAFRLGSAMAILQRARLGDATRRPWPRDSFDGHLQDDVIERIALAPISVLILGETGVGKEVMAERIHRLSPRRERKLLRLNCAALSESLLESELFGHERGAFTGAAQAKSGLLETANGGTVFLDEIGELPMGIQVKLLRVVEERKVLRVGSVTPTPIDVRFIAATNRDLDAEVGRGAFRRDLYFRINGFSLMVPPLRERIGEIESLARRFVAQASDRFGSGRQPALADDVLDVLRSYSWPGNIRELRNTVERAVALCGAGPIGLEHLSMESMSGAIGHSHGSGSGPPPVTLPEAVERHTATVEKQRIIAALDQAAGSQTAAARLLGISRRTLINRLDQYGLPRPRKGRSN